MKLVDAILRPKWLMFGATYGVISFLVSLIAAAIVSAFLAPLIPGLDSLITGADPTSTIFSTEGIAWLGVLAGACIALFVVVAAIISAIYWWIASWLYDLSRITPLWLFARKLKPTMKMVYAGLLLPGVLLVLAIVMGVVAGNIGAILTQILQFGVQIVWMIVLVYAAWFALKMVKMKIPTEG